MDAEAMTALIETSEMFMQSTCRILRRAATTSGGRTSYGVETVIAGPIDCRLKTSELRPREAEALGRLAEESYGTVALPLGTDCRGKDRVEVTTDWETVTFEVVANPFVGTHGTSLVATVQRED